MFSIVTAVAVDFAEMVVLGDEDGEGAESVVVDEVLTLLATSLFHHGDGVLARPLSLLSTLPLASQYRLPSQIKTMSVAVASRLMAPAMIARVAGLIVGRWALKEARIEDGKLSVLGWE